MCAHQCLNTRGSFKCTCNPGYELGADGKRCYREYGGLSPALPSRTGQPWLLQARACHCPLGISRAELWQCLLKDFISTFGAVYSPTQIKILV